MRDAFTHAHCDGHSHSNGNRYGYRNSDSGDFGDAYSNRNSDCNGNGYAYTITYANRNS